MWEINFTDEYTAWFKSLDEDCQAAVLSRVKLLRDYGPQLSRPYSDVLHGSKIPNLKELRAQTTAHVLRVFYYFDKARKALLLTGGDKKGKNQEDFYKQFIQEAEDLVKKYT